MNDVKMVANFWLRSGEVFNKLGAGRLSSSDGGVVTYRWKRCYEIISRANYLLACMDLVDLSEEAKAKYSGETHFLRGLAYSVLADTSLFICWQR